MLDMVSVILRLAFTWLPPWSNGVTEQGLAAALQVLRIHSQEVLRGEKKEKQRLDLMKMSKMGIITHDYFKLSTLIKP